MTKRAPERGFFHALTGFWSISVLSVNVLPCIPLRVRSG